MEKCANIFRESALRILVGVPPRYDWYNIKRKANTQSEAPLINFLNRDDVRKIINATDRQYFKVGDTVACNSSIVKDFLYDDILDFTPNLKYVIESGIKVLLYTGELDFLCNIL